MPIAKRNKRNYNVSQFCVELRQKLGMLTGVLHYNGLRWHGHSLQVY